MMLRLKKTFISLLVSFIAHQLLLQLETGKLISTKLENQKVLLTVCFLLIFDGHFHPSILWSQGCYIYPGGGTSLPAGGRIVINVEAQRRVWRGLCSKINRREVSSGAGIPAAT